MKRILFHALKEDLLPVLREVESRQPLKYVRTGVFSTDSYDMIEDGAQIESLGKATAESASASESFLISKRETPLKIRPVTGFTVQRFAIDQLWNPDTVILRPAGLWSEDIILHGLVGTVSDKPPAQALMRLFNNSLRRYFTRVNAFWVGPNALQYLRSGKRLTMAVQSPREFDLRIRDAI